MLLSTPHLLYGITIWGNARHELIDPLLKLQKRAARLALDESMSTPSVHLFRKLEWIPIYNLIKMRKILLVVSTLRSSSPSDLRELFCFSGASHDVCIVAPLLLISKYHLSNLIFPRPNSHTVVFYSSILYQMT